MSINVADLKNKVIGGAGVADLSQDELAECVEFCAKTWAAWKKSSLAAQAKAAMKSIVAGLLSTCATAALVGLFI